MPATVQGFSASGTWATTTALDRVSITGSQCPGQGEAIDPSLNVDGERVRAKGYTTDLLTDYVEAVHGASLRLVPFLAYLAHKAIHSECDPDVTIGGSVVPHSGPTQAGFVRG